MFDGVYNDNAKSAYFNGCYYLACNLNFDDEEVIGCEAGEYTNNALIELDVKSGEYNIMRGVDIQNMIVIKDVTEHTLLVCYKDGVNVKLGQISHNGKIKDVPTKKLWTSPKTDFNLPLKDKVLKEIILTSESDAKLKVTCDNSQYYFNIMGSNKPQHVKILKKGRYFSLDFLSDVAGVNISNPQVIIGYNYD